MATDELAGMGWDGEEEGCSPSNEASGCHWIIFIEFS